MVERDFQYRIVDDYTCILLQTSDDDSETIFIPNQAFDGRYIISVEASGLGKRKEYLVSTDNPNLSSVDGVLFNKEMTKLIACPKLKEGKYVVPNGVTRIGHDAFILCINLTEVILSDTVKSIGEYAFSDCGESNLKIVRMGKNVSHISKRAFEVEYSRPAWICAPQGSYAHMFAITNNEGYYMPGDCPVTWDASEWLYAFKAEGNVDYRGLRRKVWENTLSIVRDGGYTLPNGSSLLLEGDRHLADNSAFYRREFHSAVNPADCETEITVTQEDCLDVAHKWVENGEIVSVLNMASRRNPGGGVRNGAGAQEEYLFRCSDYYRSLYQYAEYASMYGLKKNKDQYPLDRNYGGIYSPNVTVFRSNEENGYALLQHPWKVNMIAVAGMNSPELIDVNGEKQIAPWLTEGVKNKIRTIFRIACDQGQKNLVLGALGCGAFHNPPRHMARLFKEVLCEAEFYRVFRKICFAVKTSHSSNRDENFKAFYETLNGFVPGKETCFEPGTDYKAVQLSEFNIRKIGVGRDNYALLRNDGKVVSVSFYKDRRWRYLDHFRQVVDIAVGFDHVIGLRASGDVVFGGECRQAGHALRTHWRDAKHIYACEGASAMIDGQGRISCAEDYSYHKTIENWTGIKQLALTYDFALGLTNDGKMVVGNAYNSRPESEEFNIGKEIKQIAAFGCYYSPVTTAALYVDGTVKAFIEDEKVEETEEWTEIKKIGCGNRIIVGLTKENVLRIVNYRGEFKDTDGNLVESIDDILDFGINFSWLVAVNRSGKIMVLDADY